MNTPLDTDTVVNHPQQRSRRVVVVSLALSIVLVVLSLGSLFFMSSADRPSRDFPLGTEFVIPEGSTLSEISTSLEAENYIRSSLFFSLLAVVRGNAEVLHAGRYVFDTPLTTSALLDALALGTGSVNVVPITFPEGIRVSEIALLGAETLSGFSAEEFIQLASTSEGYLFPDTYHVPPDMTEEELYELMRSTFDEKVATAFGATEAITPDIVSLASILEREGNAPDNMRIIAGILRSRLEIGMPLQVDASLEYERGLGSAELRIEDLETDSPYNTYTRRGLPPTPISNPGIIALRSALEPVTTDYLYYLTGNDGNFYYATTFEGHKQNKARYLR